MDFEATLYQCRSQFCCGVAIGLGVWLAGILPGVGGVELPKSFPPHPRLLFNQDALPGIRERAAGAAQQHFQSLKRQANEWLEREVTLPTKGSQWYHWYSCPKHGTRLSTEGPTRHVCPVDGQVFSGYPYDDVVLSGEHSRLAGAVRTLGMVYQVTGEARYAGKAREILLAYAGQYESYPLHDIHGEAKVGGGKVGPQTLDESVWLITVVEGADCVWDTLAKEEQEKVERGLLRPATDIIRRHKMGIHNIQCWKNSAVGLTGLLLGDLELVNEALQSESGYFNQMAKGVSPDGPWFEGAWGYHFYTLSALVHLTEGAKHSGVNLYGPELKRMFNAPLDMAMPDLTLPAFNDSSAVNIASQRALYETAFARYQDPRYLEVCGKGRADTDATLIHGVVSRSAAPEHGLMSRNFEASGNAILTAGSGPEATWLCLKYGPHGGGHGHPDKLNFVLYGMGTVIAPDPGTANYGVPIQGGWFRTTLAHNTLTLDETSQRAAEGRCEAFIATNGFSAVMAEAGAIAEGVKFYRTLALIGDNLLVGLDQVRSTLALIGDNLLMGLDQVRSAKPHKLDLAYHNRGKLPELPGATVFQSPARPGYSYLRDTQTLTSTEGLRLGFEMAEGKRVRWAMAPGEQTTFIAGTGVGRHTEDRVPIVIARREANATAYLWCVALGGDNPAPELRAETVVPADGGSPEPAERSAVRVIFGGNTYVVTANNAAGGITVAGQKVEGKIALLTQSADGLMALKYWAK
jgi:oligo-alginate lyase